MDLFNWRPRFNYQAAANYLSAICLPDGDSIGHIRKQNYELIDRSLSSVNNPTKGDAVPIYIYIYIIIYIYTYIYISIYIL